mgnify:CR=1 FL=1
MYFKEMLGDPFEDAVFSTALTEEYIVFIVCVHALYIYTQLYVYISILICALLELLFMWYKIYV